MSTHGKILLELCKSWQFSTADQCQEQGREEVQCYVTKCRARWRLCTQSRLKVGQCTWLYGWLWWRWFWGHGSKTSRWYVYKTTRFIRVWVTSGSLNLKWHSCSRHILTLNMEYIIIYFEKLKTHNTLFLIMFHYVIEVTFSLHNKRGNNYHETKTNNKVL